MLSGTGTSRKRRKLDWKQRLWVQRASRDSPGYLEQFTAARSGYFPRTCIFSILKIRCIHIKNKIKIEKVFSLEAFGL